MSSEPVSLPANKTSRNAFPNHPVSRSGPPDLSLLTGFSTDARTVRHGGQHPDAGTAREAHARMATPSAPSADPYYQPAISAVGWAPRPPARGRTGRPRPAAGGDPAMDTDQRATSVIRLLARLGWQRDPDLWTVRCRDGRGRRARLLVQLTTNGVTLMPSSPGPWTLTPLEAGRLRGAVRDALLTFDRLAGTEHHDAPPGARSPEPPSTPPAQAPALRQRVPA